MDLNLILNILISLFIYNIILRSIGSVLMQAFMKTNTAKEERKSFRERLDEKMKEESTKS
jgi:hypothetical protein